MICGGLAGMFAKTATAPLERLKMMAQTGEGGSGGVGAILRRILKTEGVAGLFAGNGANLLRVFPAKAVVFSSNDVYKSLIINAMDLQDTKKKPTYVGFTAGGLSGMTACALTYPLDLIRGRISGKGVLADGSKRYTGIVNVAMITMKEEGWTALYRGMTPTLLGCIPYEGIKFGTVGLLEGLFPVSDEDKGKTNVFRKMGFGAAGGMMAGLITYPNDTTRRLLQLQGTTGTTEVYTGYWNCVAKTYKSQGITRFYKGCGVNLVKMIPNSAAQFGAYEMLKELSVALL
jgi:solute carrier family 25 phosphate transporter 23/24/25/41